MIETLGFNEGKNGSNNKKNPNSGEWCVGGTCELAEGASELEGRCNQETGLKAIQIFLGYDQAPLTLYQNLIVCPG